MGVLKRRTLLAEQIVGLILTSKHPLTLGQPLWMPKEVVARRAVNTISFWRCMGAVNRVILHRLSLTIKFTYWRSCLDFGVGKSRGAARAVSKWLAVYASHSSCYTSARLLAVGLVRALW